MTAMLEVWLAGVLLGKILRDVSKPEASSPPAGMPPFVWSDSSRLDTATLRVQRHGKVPGCNAATLIPVSPCTHASATHPVSCLSAMPSSDTPASRVTRLAIWLPRVTQGHRLRKQSTPRKKQKNKNKNK